MQEICSVATRGIRWHNYVLQCISRNLPYHIYEQKHDIQGDSSKTCTSYAIALNHLKKM